VHTLSAVCKLTSGKEHHRYNYADRCKPVRRIFFTTLLFQTFPLPALFLGLIPSFSFFTTNLPQICLFMSQSLSLFVQSLKTCFFSYKFTTIFFLSTINLPQICLFTVLSVPVHRKFTARFPFLRQSLSVFIASLLQVFFLLSTANLLQIRLILPQTLTLFNTTLQQVYPFYHKIAASLP